MIKENKQELFVAGKGLNRDNSILTKILHVEDDTSFAKASKTVLESDYNFRIKLASSVKEAYEKLKTEQFDVIVSDFEMPIQDGIAFLEELVKTQSELPFILFTGKGREEVAIKALNLGASGYINKHGDPETVYGELAQRIVQAVEKKRQKCLAQTLLDSLPCIAMLLKPKDRQIIASNKAAIAVGATTGKICYSTWGMSDPCTWCLAPDVWETNQPQHVEVEHEGIIWDMYWIPVEKDLYLHYAFDVTETRQKEKKLVESENHFRTITDHMYDWEYWIAPDGSLRFVSLSTKKLTGYSAEEFINNPRLLYEIVHPDDKPRLVDHFTKITQETTQPLDFRIITKDGKTQWLAHACQPVFDENGTFLGRRISNRNVTSRKKAEEEIADLSRFPSENPHPVLRISKDGQVLYHNDAANRSFSIQGKPSGVLSTIIEQAKTVLETRKKKVVEVTVNKKVFLLTFAPIAKSGYVNVYGCEVTDKKKIEAKLAKYSKELESLVKERSDRLDVAEQQLLKAERLAAIGELAGMIGHDLRNPLTGIKTSIYYLKKKKLADADSTTKDMIEIIEKCIDHANKIINDLLEYAREVQLEIQSSTPEAIISETIAMIKIPNEITVLNEVTNQSGIAVDTDKMKRVFSNLIKNAVEAMPNGGSLRISCKQAKEGFEFCFVDTGPGIPPQVMEKIFSPLVTTKAQGMGFGLAICKRIVEAHGGVIDVRTCSKGTKFSVKVPTKQ